MKTHSISKFPHRRWFICSPLNVVRCSVVTRVLSSFQICVWSTEVWNDQASKPVHISSGRGRNPPRKNRVQFHQDQIHLLVFNESLIAVYEAPELKCIENLIAVYEAPELKCIEQVCSIYELLKYLSLPPFKIDSVNNHLLCSI